MSASRIQTPGRPAPRTTSTARCARGASRTSSARSRSRSSSRVSRRGGDRPRRGARPRAARRPARPGQDLAGPDRRRRARRARSSRPPARRSSARPTSPRSSPRSSRARSSSSTRSTACRARSRRRSTRRWRTRQLPITVGQGAGARVVTLDLPALHARRRHHPRRPADDAAARPLRDPAPPRALRPGDLGADRAALGPAARRRDRRRRRAGDRRALRAAPRAWPTGCSSACATTPRCAAPAVVDRRRRAAALDLLEVDEQGLDRLDREILRAALREVRRRPRRPVHAGRRGGGGGGHDRGRLRALPAAAGPARAHAARAACATRRAWAHLGLGAAPRAAARPRSR